MGQTPERYHALDFLRAVAMLLGIALHAALSFTDRPVPFWPVRDVERSPAADVFVYTVHEFRMQTFFLLAGFFGCLLYHRYSLGGMLRHRCKRILVPFVLALLLVGPVLQAIWMLGDPSALRFVGLPAPEPGQTRWDAIAQHFASGAFLAKLRPWHLWFLYYLCMLFLVMVPLLWLGRRVAGTAFAECIDAGFRRLAVLRGKSFVLAVVFIPLLWGSRFWAVDTPEAWPVHPDVLAYYFVFFAFGWMLFRHRELLGAFAARWRSALLLGNLLVLPVMLGLFVAGLPLRDSPDADPAKLIVLKTGVIYLGGVYSWLMVGGLTGAFLHWFGRERAWVRYLADSAYWCYLIHLVPVVLLQMAVAQLEIPGPVKFVAVLAGSMAVLLLSYQLAVRYTVIGSILNGPRKKNLTSPAPLP